MWVTVINFSTIIIFFSASSMLITRQTIMPYQKCHDSNAKKEIVCITSDKRKHEKKQPL